MLRIKSAQALERRLLRLTLTDGSSVERDVQDLLWGPIFDRLRVDDELFRRVRARHGTVAWPGGLDLAPETLIWDGPEPADDDPRRPPASMRPRRLRDEASRTPDSDQKL
jgi:hypothetical protein